MAHGAQPNRKRKEGCKMSLIESETRYPGLPQVKYTREDLLNICESHPHPAIRRIAADMLYTMGKRDQTAENVERLS